MCGIIGYLGYDNFINYIISGLKLIQNRGYDSVGIATIIDNQIKTIKYASTNNYDSLEKLSNLVINEPLESNIGIGHTRWATHGSKIDINAHPHSDNLNRISLVHNGIIENFNILKSELLKENYNFASQTDTEIIAVLVGYYLDKNYNINEAIQKTVNRLIGTWALAIIYNQEPNKIWLIRNGSPLLLGINDNFIMIASESIAFNNFINKYIILDNHDLIEITFNNNKISYNKCIDKYLIKNKSDNNFCLTPEPYNYWLEKEIKEQIITVTNAYNNGGRLLSEIQVKLGGLDSKKELLLEIKHLILLGCGTSFNAGLWAIDIFKSLDIFHTVSVYDGSEFTYKDIPKLGKTGLIFLSQSGETKDLHLCLTERLTLILTVVLH
jgi:glucosamine--fructose-6-phosphate aminotransferase (isomerizing)